MAQTIAGTNGITRQLTQGELKADFDFMRYMLEAAHPGLYRYTTKPEMDRIFAAQRAKLNHPMSSVEFLAVAAETVAHIRCGHTKIALDDQSQSQMNGARKFPFRILVENKRLMVLFNDTLDNETIRPGMEITEVNGHSAEEIIARIWPMLPGDGDIDTGKWRDIGERFSEYYWLLFAQSEEFVVRAKDARGVPVVAKVSGVTDAERQTNRNPVNDVIHSDVAQLMGWAHDNVSLRFLSDPEIAEIRLSHFTGDDFSTRLEDTFKILREKGTKTLIIDLRGNGGGDDLNGAILVSYLTEKPFRYFDHINVRPATLSLGEQFGWSAEFEGRLRENITPNAMGNYSLTAEMNPGLAEQQPGKYRFTGKVFVLIDGGTFSGAADFCAVLHHLKRAIFIGQETGGGYYGNNSGEMPIITLPHSKLQMRLPLYEYWNSVPGYPGLRRGTPPNYAVTTTLAAVLRGIDEQLDLALEFAKH